jgi:hypothetical protein
MVDKLHSAAIANRGRSGLAGLFGLSKRYPLGAEARAIEVDGANDLHGTARGQGVQVAPVP